MLAKCEVSASECSCGRSLVGSRCAPTGVDVRRGRASGVFVGEGCMLPSKDLDRFRDLSADMAATSSATGSVNTGISCRNGTLWESSLKRSLL